MITRRSLLAATGTVAASAALHPAFAADQVVVGTYGGDYDDLLVANVEKPLLVPKGIESVADLAGADPRKTKLIAERNSRRGSFDVVHLSGTDMYQLAQLGIFEDVAADKVPNLAHAIPALRRPYSVPHIFSAQVILYNPSKITTPPKGFADLWDPRWKGRVGIPDGNYGTIAFGTALISGGSMSNWEPAKQKLLELRANEPKLYPSNETLADGLKSEEVWITPMWLARGFMWQKAGIKLAHVVPQEGAIPVTFEAAVPKNARNKDGGWAYLNAMLAPSAQVGFADRMGYVPTVSDAVLPPALASQISFTPAETAAFRTPDFDYQAKSNSGILDFWTKQFKA